MHCSMREVDASMNIDTCASLTMSAQLHGYDYKFVQVRNQEGHYNTWVKLKDQFLLTMREEYQFVVLTDADIIFNDLRIPLDFLGHWNVTSGIAVAGGR